MTQRLTDTSPRRAHAARFGAELTRAMAERGISNKVLRTAARIGSTSNVSEWRNGHNLPGIEAAQDRDAEHAPAPEVIDAADVVRWVRDLPRLWEMAEPEQRREMVGLVYERIVIEGGRIVEAIPTAYALARGLPALLPERIGGAGEPGRSQHRQSNHGGIVIPVRGRRELLRAMRRTA